MDYNLDKFKNAILFFAKCVDGLGITKLNKLLYYSDFEHFRLYGVQILGDQYVKMGKGPVPSLSYATFNANFSTNEDSTLKDTIDVQKETWIESILGRERVMKRIIPKHEPDLSVFSKSEIAVMQEIATKWKSATASAMSFQSHLESPWKDTEELGVIDYKLALNGDSVSRKYVEYKEAEDQLLESALSQ